MTSTVTIREAQPGDSRALNDYMVATYKVARHLITRPDEFRPQPFARRLWIAKKQLNEFELCIVAEEDGNIIGMLECWTDRRQRITHVTTFAMSVAPDSQGKGVGKALLTHYIDWVRDHPHLRKIDLHVHSDNVAAKAMYEKLGFKKQGVRKAQIIYEDGRVIDDILMTLWPKGDEPEATHPAEPD